MNRAIIYGNVGQTPELRYTQSGTPVINFSVATTETSKDKNGQVQKETEWHNCQAWAKQAELISKYVTSGSKVLVEGRLKTETWEKNGAKHYKTNLVVNRIEFGPNRNPQQPGQAAAPGQEAPPAFEDIPF